MGCGRNHRGQYSRRHFRLLFPFASAVEGYSWPAAAKIPDLGVEHQGQLRRLGNSKLHQGAVR